MAKKGQTVQLQTELNTDEEWEKYLEKPGLLVIDIYSDWCGPCSAMQATLKKIKVEYGGDTLQLAIAKCDTIEALERFRGKSEPTWMFVSRGKMVNFLYGASAPLLTKIINEELRIQKMVDEGSYVRSNVLEVTDRAPAEAERWEVVQQELAAEVAMERAKKAEEIHNRLTKESDAILENLGNLGVIIVFPHARDKYNEVLKDLMNEAGLVVSLSEKMRITEEQIRSISYFCGDNQDMYLPQNSLDHLFSQDCQVLVVKAGHGTLEMEDPVSVRILDVIYGPTREPPGEEECPYRQLIKWAKKSEEMVMTNSEAVLASLDVKSINDIPTKSPLEISESATKNVEIEEKTEEEDKQEEEVDRENFLIGIWAPPTRRILSSCFKVFFPRMAAPLLIPEPPPKPPYITICFNIDRKAKVQSLMSKWENEIARYGIFTSVNPDEAELVAKSFKKYDQIPTKDGNEKIVIQLARKKSECLLSFATEVPNYMSPNVSLAKKELKKFFPEDYDELTEDIDEDYEEIVEEPEDIELEEVTDEEEMISEEEEYEEEIELEELEGEEEEIMMEEGFSQEEMFELITSEPPQIDVDVIEPSSEAEATSEGAPTSDAGVEDPQPQ